MKKGIPLLVLIALLVACRSMVTNITLDYKPSAQAKAAGGDAKKICLVATKDERKNPFFLGRIRTGAYNLQARDIATETDVPTFVTQALEIELKNAQYGVKSVDEIPEKADVPVVTAVLRKTEIGRPFLKIEGSFWAEMEISVRVVDAAGVALVDKTYTEKKVGGFLKGADVVLPELFSKCLQAILQSFLADLKSALG